MQNMYKRRTVSGKSAGEGVAPPKAPSDQADVDALFDGSASYPVVPSAPRAGSTSAPVSESGARADETAPAPLPPPPAFGQKLQGEPPPNLPPLPAKKGGLGPVPKKAPAATKKPPLPAATIIGKATPAPARGKPPVRFPPAKKPRPKDAAAEAEPARGPSSPERATPRIPLEPVPEALARAAKRPEAKPKKGNRPAPVSGDLEGSSSVMERKLVRSARVKVAASKRVVDPADSNVVTAPWEAVPEKKASKPPKIVIIGAASAVAAGLLAWAVVGGEGEQAADVENDAIAAFEKVEHEPPPSPEPEPAPEPAPPAAQPEPDVEADERPARRPKQTSASAAKPRPNPAPEPSAEPTPEADPKQEPNPEREPAEEGPTAADLAKQGMAAWKHGDTNGARTLYEEALAQDSRNRTALAGLGEFYFEEGNFSKAEDYFVRASARSPKDGKLLLRLGDTFFKRAQYSKARTHYERAQKLGTSGADDRIDQVERKGG
jgi:TolA-binding protein